MIDSFVTINYPGEPLGPHEELIGAQHVMGDHYRLQSHSLFLPLGPGDIVKAPGGVAEGVTSLTEDWIIEVFIKEAVSDADAGELIEEWGRAVRFTKLSPIVVRLNSSTKEWVDDQVVRRHREQVNFIDVLRRPGGLVDFEAEVARR